MEAICYYNFPICPPPRNTEDSRPASAIAKSSVVVRKRLCREDCHLVTKGECSDAYKIIMGMQSQGKQLIDTSSIDSWWIMLLHLLVRMQVDLVDTRLIQFLPPSFLLSWHFLLFIIWHLDVIISPLVSLTFPVIVSIV